MASSKMVWEGMEEYLEELRKLPEDCRAEATREIEAGVNRAYVQIATVYGRHSRTGNLRRGLKISAVKDGLILKSTAKHAHIFDRGSQARHWVGGKSTGKMWGKTPSPPMHIFSRTVAKEGRKLTQYFKDMLIRRGAVAVTGDK